MTRVYENGRIINVEYDDYGNIKRLGNIELKYNLQNKISEYKKDNDVYKYEYNYQGIRTKKTKDQEYEVIYYLDNDRIIGEDKKDLTTNQIIHKLRYYYDVNGICGINYIIEDEDHYFNVIKDSIGNITKLMYRGKVIGEYIYNAWGEVETKIYEDTNPSSIDRYVIENNPFRYKGYYYDKETGLAMVGHRYYSPKLCRFIQPVDVSSLNPYSINGLSLYAYMNNNPVDRAKLSSTTNLGTLSGFSTTMMISTFGIPNVTSKVGNGNYWNPHWENQWFDTDGPRFFVLSQEGFEVVNWGLSIYKGSLYFNNNENYSLYVSAGNIGVYVGINYKKGIGIDAGASVLEIGYDGRIIDASIEGFTVGITYMYKDGKFKFGFGAGWFGWSISIDFVELFKLLFGGE